MMTFLRTLGIMAVLTLFVGGAPRPALAETYDSDTSDHPARYVIYPVHAFGKALETFVTRPIHWVVSRPKLRYVFGHVSNPKTEDYSGDFELYQRYRY